MSAAPLLARITSRLPGGFATLPHVDPVTLRAADTPQANAATADNAGMHALNVPLFRAENTDKFRLDQEQERRNSVRLPVNVPYVVDNLWEHLRPGSMPSRRHSVYASPTPQQALASGTKGTLVVGELRFSGTVKLVQ